MSGYFCLDSATHRRGCAAQLLCARGAPKLLCWAKGTLSDHRTKSQIIGVIYGMKIPSSLCSVFLCSATSQYVSLALHTLVHCLFCKGSLLTAPRASNIMGYVYVPSAPGVFIEQANEQFLGRFARRRNANRANVFVCPVEL